MFVWSVGEVEGRVLVRLVEGLISVLVQQLEQGSTSSGGCERITTPWLLLYAVLQHQDVASAAPRPRPSTLLLVTAHDELAK